MNPTAAATTHAQSIRMASATSILQDNVQTLLASQIDLLALQETTSGLTTAAVLSSQSKDTSLKLALDFVVEFEFQRKL